MATVVRFVGGPFAGQAEANDHRFRSAARRWRDHGGNGKSGLRGAPACSWFDQMDFGASQLGGSDREQNASMLGERTRLRFRRARVLATVDFYWAIQANKRPCGCGTPAHFLSKIA